MPKEASTKAAATKGEAKTTRSKKSASTEEGAKAKTPRAPSAYNEYMKEKLPAYKVDHPDTNHKEAFAAVAKQWADAPENPKRGQEKVPRAAAKPKEPKATKAKKPAAKTDDEDEEAADEPADEAEGETSES